MKLNEVVIFLSIIVSIEPGEVKRDDLRGHDDCCKLNWEQVTKFSNSRTSIPNNAILAGSREEDQVQLYFGIWEDYFTVLTDEVSKEAYTIYWNMTEDKLKRLFRNGSTDIYILNNPNKCYIDWFERSIDDYTTIEDTATKYFPNLMVNLNGKIKKYVFGRHVTNESESKSVGLIEVPTGGKSFLSSDYWRGPDISLGSLYVPSKYDILEILHIDCQKTMLKNFRAELYNIEFDTDLMAESDKKVVAKTEIINDSDVTQKSSVELRSEVISSLEMRHESRTKNILDGSISARLMGSLGGNLKKIGFSLSGGAGITAGLRKETLASEGTIEFESFKTFFRFHETIHVKPKTKTIISINTNILNGSRPYTAYYSIIPSGLNLIDKQGFETVKNTFKRLGYDDIEIDFHKRTLEFKVPGVINLSGGYDSHVIIESCPVEKATCSDSDPGMRQITYIEGEITPI